MTHGTGVFTQTLADRKNIEWDVKGFQKFPLIILSIVPDLL
jgi:hypothetical protein